jgi:ribulose-phosphate 3-epimerase
MSDQRHLHFLPKAGIIKAEGRLSRRKVKIAPSILAADFGRLAQQVAEAEAGGADYIHVDVMDGHYVPNISMGPAVVEAVRRATRLPLDVHLMTESPERFVADFAAAGADMLTVHVETCPHLHRIVQEIRDLGCQAGVTLNPSTPLSALDEILPYVDLVLVMSVNPGFGGQEFIKGILPKIRRLREMMEAMGSIAELEVDGGITQDTASSVVQAGANVLVAGSAVFASNVGIGEAIAEMRRSALRDEVDGQP